MKHILLPLGAAVCAATSAFAASVTAVVDVDTANVTATRAPQINVTTEGNPALVYADWWQGDKTNNKVRVFLSGTGNSWSGLLPVNHAGTAHYVLWAETADGVATDYAERSYTIREATGTEIADARELTNQRYPYIFDWSATDTSFDGYLDDHWYGQNIVRDKVALPQAVGLLGTTTDNTPTPTGTTAGGFVRTRVQVDDGVGSIWFKARMNQPNGRDGTLVIERITVTLRNGRPVYAYEDIATVQVPPSDAFNQWHQFHLILQDIPVNNTAIYRIRNKTKILPNSGETVSDLRIDLSDIVLTPPLPDVKVYKDEADYGPAGYPSVRDPIEFHVAVSNRCEGAPAQYITPRLVWRQMDGLHWGDWNEVVMTNLEGRTVQGDGTYACVLDLHAPENSQRRIRAGDFEYFYEVSFTGYTPTFPAIKDAHNPLLNDIQNNKFDWAQYPYLIHTNAWGLLTDGNGNVSECRAPALRPDFTDDETPRGGIAPTYYSFNYGSVAFWNDETDAPAWDYTPRFDVRKLADGWPTAPATHFTRVYLNQGWRAVTVSSGVEVPATYRYYKLQAADGIRHFRSENDLLGLVVEDLFPEERPGGLPVSNPMQQVGDYMWQAILHTTNFVDAYMYPTSANHHVAGSTIYHKGPYAWFEQGQPETAINPPTGGDVKPVQLASGTKSKRVPEPEVDEEGHIRVDPDTGAVIYKRDENGRIVYKTVQVPAMTPDWANSVTNSDFSETALALSPDWAVVATNAESAAAAMDAATNNAAPPRIQINYDGFLMFRFCTTNGQYEVRRAAWQDFNDWAADIHYFTRSYGLYDMAVFKSDAEGRELTENDSMVARHFQYAPYGLVDDPPDEGSSPVADARFTDGFVVRNAWFSRDRKIRLQTTYDGTGAASGQTRQTNDAVRLSAASYAPGTIETTSMTKPLDGRGKFSFLARPSVDDPVVQYYAPGLAWTEGYFVLARVSDVSMSDAEDPHVAVYACWQDERNWIQVRLVQKTRYANLPEGGTVMSETTLKSCEKNYLELQIWESVNGTERQLPVTDSWHTGTSGLKAMRFPWDSGNDGDNYKLDNANGWLIGLEVKPSGSSTSVRALLYRDKTNGHNSAGITGNANTYCYPVGNHYTDDGNGSRDITGTSSLSFGGTIAFNVKDAAASFNPWTWTATEWEEMGDTQNKGHVRAVQSGSSSFGAVFNAGQSSWKQATSEHRDWIEPWDDVVKGGGVATNPTKLRRPVPTVYFRVETYRTGEETTPDTVAPVPMNDVDWAADWDDVGRKENNRSDIVRSAGTDFAWRRVEVDMRLWDDTFVRVRALPDDGAGNPSTGTLTVDEFECTGWRGKTIYDPDLTDRAGLESSWIGTYARIEREARTERKWALEVSRANPAKRYQKSATDTMPEAYADWAQAITTPLLRNGVGDLLFNYWVADTNQPVVFAVEMVDERTGLVIQDDEFSSVVRTAAVTTATSLYVPALRADVSGRLRIRTLPDDAGTSIAGTLYVDDLRTTDYPNTGDTSWEAYNTLVSTFAATEDDLKADMWEGVTDTASKFDMQNAAYRSAVINNEPDFGTPPPDQTWPDHVPFVMTPAIVTGVGEVSFWYRRAPGETRPGRISLQVAQTQRAPDVAWVPLTADDLNTNWVEKTVGGQTVLVRENENYDAEVARLEALNEITTDDWTYFSAEFYQIENNVLRIFSGTNGPASYAAHGDTGSGLVMIDNVLVTEPVRSSIDVGNIEFNWDATVSPGVPLTTKDTNVRITLANPRMNPEDIRVWLDWYVASSASPTALVSRTSFVDVNVTTNPVTTNMWIEAVGAVVPVTYNVVNVTETPYDVVAETHVPTSLPSSWGYDNWKGARSGRIEFERDENNPLVFHSKTDLPTGRYPADTVFQYCAYVEYNGRFSAPIVSETAVRSSTAFWYENPTWYTPIDLNALLDTTNKPVAHFWNLTVGTNLVAVNEIKTSGGSIASTSGSRKQLAYVELIGPSGADVTGWRLRTADVNPSSGNPLPGSDQWTNVLGTVTADGAAKSPASARFREASNTTTNKGWGVYLLGGEDVEGRDELLMPTGNQGLPCLFHSDAIVLERTMGAWVERDCWANASSASTGKQTVKTFIQRGYDYLGNVQANDSRSYYPNYSRIPSTTGEAGSMVWSAARDARSATPGAFNRGDQEMYLNDLLAGETIVVPPLLSKPVVTSFGFNQDGTATLSFSVQTTNGVALAAGDFTWYLLAGDEIYQEEEYWTINGTGVHSVAADKAIEAAADTPVEVTIPSIPLDAAETKFFWIYATDEE